MRALDIAATGLQAQQTHVDTISQNLANLTTTGYKRQRAEFQDLLYQTQRRVGASSGEAGTLVPIGIQLGVGVKTAAISRITEQGNIQVTDNPLDVAIQGRGYFQIELPTGEIAYTRDGTFRVNQDGLIVNADGYTVLPGITVPQDATQVSISAAGVVEAKIDGQTQPQNLGQIELTTFINPPGLDAIGNNLFLETPASGDPINGLPAEEGFGTLLQGALETSNVNPVSEITSLIVAQRAYQMNTKVITAMDEMLQTVAQAT